MKIFKNRGDIYISKSKGIKSAEERVLLIILAVIVILTIVFVVMLSQKYSSVAEFFVGEDVSLSDSAGDETQALPQISGKSNYLFIETDDENTTVHYVILIQADGDNKAYKVCTLSPNTKIDGTTIEKIYEQGAGASLQTKLTEFFGFEIDYYIQFNNNKFIDFTDKLGTFIYPSSQAVEYSGGKGDDTYTVRIKEGEQNLDGKDLTNIIRYYVNEKKNYQIPNEIMLYALTNYVSEDNLENSEELFRMFIADCSTNITVKNFADSTDALTVFCKSSRGITVYSANAKYDALELTPQSVQEIKGYFSK
ncbi:MAG: LCP family protein [Eubacterium sp.]